MNYKIDYNASIHAIVIETSGSMNGADFIKMATDILNNPHWMLNQNVIFDHRELDFTGVVLSELSQIRAFHLEHQNTIGVGKSAIVVKPGYAGQWYLLWSKGEKINTAGKLRVFENFGEAADWIKEK